MLNNDVKNFLNMIKAVLFIFLVFFTVNFALAHNNEEQKFISSDNVIKLFFLSPLETRKPINACETEACQALLREINNSKETIDFAIYGIGGQDVIFNAIVQAKKRGVKIRGVTDADKNGVNIYKDTEKLMQILGTMKTDSILSNDKESESELGFQTAIMHDKFFVIDKKFVWTGSANISSTDITGFNSNVVLLIKSPQIISLYLQEFEQMFQGKFHTFKKAVQNNENIIIPDNSVVSVYFSPEHQAISTKIIPLIYNAKRYIYIPAFYLTHKQLSQSLIDAHKRGVDIKIIIDATSASGKYAVHKTLREEGISVKVENFAGKMHMKSIIIDDNTLVIGSMNFTNQGEKRNDENCLIIKNNSDMTIKYREHFLQLWKAISDKWLYANPPAESSDSPGSCSDGVDNDFDGFVDSNDFGCTSRSKVTK